MDIQCSALATSMVMMMVNDDDDDDGGGGGDGGDDGGDGGVHGDGGEDFPNSIYTNSRSTASAATTGTNMIPAIGPQTACFFVLAVLF